MVDIVLKSYKYDECLSNSIVINLSQIHTHFLIELKDKFSHTYDIVSLNQISPKEGNNVASEVDKNQKWIRIPKESLDLSEGSHVYEIILEQNSFYDKYLDSKSSVYFSYRIQNDNPDKPYIYMKREEPDESVESNL